MIYEKGKNRAITFKIDNSIWDEIKRYHKMLHVKNDKISLQARVNHALTLLIKEMRADYVSKFEK